MRFAGRDPIEDLDRDVTTNELTRPARSACLGSGLAHLCLADDHRKVVGMSTTYAPQTVHVAVGARPCGLDLGYWRAAAVPSGVNPNFMNGTTIKHSARHLGTQPT